MKAKIENLLGQAKSYIMLANNIPESRDYYRQKAKQCLMVVRFLKNRKGVNLTNDYQTVTLLVA